MATEVIQINRAAYRRSRCCSKEPRLVRLKPLGRWDKCYRRVLTRFGFTAMPNKAVQPHTGHKTSRGFECPGSLGT